VGFWRADSVVRVVALILSLLWLGWTIECRQASGVNGVGPAVMHLVRGHQPDPGVVTLPIVPAEEGAAEAPGVLDAAEAFPEARRMSQRLEVAFGESRHRALFQPARTTMSAPALGTAVASISRISRPRHGAGAPAAST
jgi:hypothetical protein